MDLDSIKGGEKFSAAIDEKIKASDVLLAVIGSRWLTLSEDGIRRLDNPDDFVRLEIGKALARNVRVIPVLVGGATMPLPRDLPDDLRALAERQAIEIRDSDFHIDSQQLADVVLSVLPGIGLKPARWSFTNPVVRVAGVATIVAVVLGSTFLLLRDEIGAKRDGVTEKLEARNPSSAAGLLGSKRRDLSGTWSASIRYDWGDTHTEAFDFVVEDGNLSGTAGFLKHGRSIMNGTVSGDKIAFFTTSQTMMGGGEIQEKHSYRGTVQGDTIRFSMTTESPTSSHVPVQFVAQRKSN